MSRINRFKLSVPTVTDYGAISMEDMMYLPYDVVEDINRLRDEEREHAQMISWLWADAPDDVPLSHTDDDETEEEVETVY